MYIEKMFLPFDLAVFYPLVQIPLWKSCGAILLLSGSLFLVLLYSHRYPYIVTGWFWYLITLLPTLGIVQVGRQAMADRYTYIPLIGLFAVAGWGGAELAAKVPKLKKVIPFFAAGIVLFLSVTTCVQLGYWSDNFRLFTHTLEVTENNYFAHSSLGIVYEQQGKPDLAIAEYRKSLAIEPRDPIVHFDLGYLLDKQGRTSEAIGELEEAIATDPGYAQAYFTLGIILERIGAIDESIRRFNDALRIEPDNAKYHNNLGTTLAKQGMLDEAIEQFSIALQLNPDDGKAYANLQIALQQKGQKGSR